MRRTSGRECLAVVWHGGHDPGEPQVRSQPAVCESVSAGAKDKRVASEWLDDIEVSCPLLGLKHCGAGQLIRPGTISETKLHFAQSTSRNLRIRVKKQETGTWAYGPALISSSSVTYRHYGRIDPSGFSGTMLCLKLAHPEY